MVFCFERISREILSWSDVGTIAGRWRVARATIACHVRACMVRARFGAIHRSHTPFHHRTYIRIYPIPYLRNNHVIFKMLLCPHGLLCINKNWYEITRKKVRHFFHALCCYYDNSVYISIMTPIIVFITVSFITLALQVRYDRKEYFKHHKK